MYGKEEHIRYEDITSFAMDDSGDLKLYQNDKCILKFATAEHKVFIREVLKKRKVGIKTNTTSSNIIMKMGKGYCK